MGNIWGVGGKYILTSHQAGASPVVAEWFGGVKDQKDGALIDTALRKYVAGKLKEESEVKKEQRKWREEQPGGAGKK